MADPRIADFEPFGLGQLVEGAIRASVGSPLVSAATSRKALKNDSVQLIDLLCALIK